MSEVTATIDACNQCERMRSIRWTCAAWRRLARAAMPGGPWRVRNLARGPCGAVSAFPGPSDGFVFAFLQARGARRWWRRRREAELRRRARRAAVCLRGVEGGPERPAGGAGAAGRRNARELPLMQVAGDRTPTNTGATGSRHPG